MLLMISCFVCYIESVGINKKDDEVHLKKKKDICNSAYGTDRKSLV